MFVPIALMGVVCFYRRFSELAILALGALICAAFIVALLFARGELWPLVQTVKMNIAYSQGSLIGSNHGVASVVAHLKRLGGSNLFAEVVPTLLAITVGLIALPRESEFHETRQAMIAASILTFVGAFAVLSTTGLWQQHRQILYIPAVVAVLAVSPLLDSAAKIARLRTLGLIFLIGFLMAGPFTLKEHIAHIRTFRESYAALHELSPEAQRLLAIATFGTYARLGGNDDEGHAFGL
jgi:hypothetical protein